MPLKMTFGQIVRRILLYLGLAFASLAVLAMPFALNVHAGIVIPGQWIGLATFTVVLIVATIQSSKKYWRDVSYWFILAGLVCLHSLAFILILRNFPDFRMIWYVPIVVVEAGIFGGIYDLLLARTTR